MSRLVLRYHEGDLTLGRGRALIGRGRDCDVRLVDAAVSRHHAALYVDPDRAFLQDLGSRNGVYLNGRRVVGRIELHAQDVIRIGGQSLEIIETPSDLPPPFTTPPTQRIDRRAGVTEAERIARLSPREREVLQLVAEGHTHRDIADRLGISVKSVETYKSRVALKLGIETRVDFVRLALEAGLLRATGAPER